MAEDISKTTVGVLLILVIVISIIGTWVVLDKTSNLDYQPNIKSTTQGYIKLQILPTNSTQPEKSISKPSYATGYVTLNILSKGG